MKDKRNWSSELKQENVSIGLDKVSYKLDGKVVCLHTEMKYGVPDALTVYMVTNFKELGIKKLIITNFPISDEPEEWADLLEGEKYVIEKVPSKLTDSDSYTSVTVEQFLAKHKETFKVKDNSKQAAHIKLIKAADIVIGFPSVNILEPYVKMICNYNKNFIIGGYVTDENFNDYIETFQMRKFEMAASDKVQISEGFCRYDGSLIWLDNFDKFKPVYFADDFYACGGEEM